MDLMTANEAAKKWGISPKRVTMLCAENRITGVKFVEKIWLIPKTANKPEESRIVSLESPEQVDVKPFLKWAGGKTQILEEIRLRYPQQLGKSINKYAEPFVGGGAVLFDILNKYNLKDVFISDINRELIMTYITIRDSVTELVEMLKRLETDYLFSNEEVRKEIYYNKRERFNVLKSEVSDSVELAVLFIFLNRTCFNGLYRVNSYGKFNVPQGRYKNPTICDSVNLSMVSEKLQNVEIICGDYQMSRKFIDENTFAYFDPPYRPLTTTANFTSYATDNFGDTEQKELAQFIDEMSNRGAYIIASNSDPRNTDEKDDFFDRLYSKHNIARVSANRAINSISSSRGKISELLICNYREDF